MNFIQPEDRDYIMRKHQEKRYEAATGLDNEQIKEGVEAFYALSRQENHALVKAKAFDYVLSNTQIDVNEHDWFIGIAQSGQRTIRNAQCLKWLEDVRETLSPDFVEEEKRHHRKDFLLSVHGNF